MPEYILATMAAAMLGWGGFTWRRSERAAEIARQAQESTDKLELKLAEKYLTKDEFEYQMERLFKTLGRLEEKLDCYVFSQAQDTSFISSRLRKLKDLDD